MQRAVDFAVEGDVATLELRTLQRDPADQQRQHIQLKAHTLDF